MIVVSTIFVLFSLVHSKSVLLLAGFIGVTLASSIASFYLSSFCLQAYEGYMITYDEYGVTLSYMMLIVVFFSLLVYFQTYSDSHPNLDLLWVLICVIILASILVFSSSSLLAVYVGYESSLIPIILIIYGWGAYPERVYSALVILLYTLLFSLPLLGVLSYMWYSPIFSMSASLTSLVSSSSCTIDITTFALLLFLAFAVNLPVYGIHSWLPLAHVEAPTFGSMILAGLLLNLGGCGLYRFTSVVPSIILDLQPYLLGYLYVSIVVVSVITCVQSDLNRLIAYSSVVHITSVGVLLLLGNTAGLNAALILIVIHGISSPLIFFMVGEVYRSLQTRSLLLIRSLKFYFPILYVSIAVVFYLTVPVPPSLTFLGEILMFVSILSQSYVVAVIIGIYLFLAIVFNLVWLSSFFGSAWHPHPTGISVASSYTALALVSLGALAGLMCNSLFL